MPSLKKKILMTTAIGLFSLAGVATDAKAQESYMPPQDQQQQESYMPPQDQQQMNISDTDLQEFVKAQQVITQVQTDFQNQAANLSSQEDMQNLQEQANQEIIEAIEETDLSVDKYNLIFSSLQNDPTLQERYMQYIQ